MKKIILFFALIIGSLNLTSQVATASLQTQGNNTLTILKQKLDTIAQLERAIKAQIVALQNGVTLVDIYYKVQQTASNSDELPVIRTTEQAINTKLAGTLTVTPLAGSIYTVIQSGVVSTSITALPSNTTNLSTSANQATGNGYLSSLKLSSDTTNQLLRATRNVSVTNTATVTGNVGGYTGKTSNTITTSTSPAYSSGDNIGGINTATNVFRSVGSTAVLNDIIIWDRDNQKPNMVIDFFDASPTAGTYTDNAAEVLVGDYPKWLGSYSVSSSDFITQGAIARASITGVALTLKSSASTSLYYTISTTSTPTYTTTSGLIIKLGILQD